MSDWGYEEHNGPAHWHKYAPACTGTCQSPVDIVTSQAAHNEKLKKVTIACDPKQTQVLTNNGRTVQVNIAGKSTISDGPLDKKDEYELKQYHFHWGSKDGNGSEHTVDGKSYSAELHLVHWKSSHGSFEEALKHKDGLIVLAVFLDVDKQEHKKLKELQNNFTNVTQPASTFNLDGKLDPYSLLPEEQKSYWTYPGSLTTPPCLEVATFVIYKEPIKVTSAQLQAFRDLKPIWVTKEQDASKVAGARLENNFRPTLPLNGRKIEASFK